MHNKANGRAQSRLRRRPVCSISTARLPVSRPPKGRGGRSDDIANRPELWIFAYGSLMWRPDFAFEEQRRARVFGFHRALCIYSHHYRGTVDRPGLVLGLDRGGSCVGLCFRIAAEAAAATLDAVRERELVTGVYAEIAAPVRLDDGRRRMAVTYVARRTHPQYAGALPPQEVGRLVRQGVGVAGSDLDYVRNTHRHLADLGIRDPALASVLDPDGPRPASDHSMPKGFARPVET